MFAERTHLIMEDVVLSLLQGIPYLPVVFNYLIIGGITHLFSRLNFVMAHTSNATKMRSISKIVFQETNHFIFYFILVS